jgi:hypothetical protein
MTLADALADLDRGFREAFARYPDLWHLVIKFPKDCESPDNPADQRARCLAWVLAGDSRFEGPTILVPWEEQLGQQQIFYGESAAWEGPCGRRFVSLARVGVTLASESGLISPTPPPDRGGAGIERFHWPATWMNIVYRRAREQRPNSRLWVVESSSWNGHDLPEGMRVAELSSGVFIASAYAAELLARDAEIPPGPKSGLSISGNKVTVDGIIYHLDDGPAAFVQELVDAGVGVWISGPKMGPMVKPYPSRIRKQITQKHPEIAAWIESSPFKGFRLMSQRGPDKTKNGPR